MRLARAASAASAESVERPCKVPHLVAKEKVTWGSNSHSHFLLEVRGDNLSMIRWVPDLWRCQQLELRGALEQVLDIVSALVVAGVRSPAKGTELMRHISRGSVDTDSLAGRRETFEVHHEIRPCEFYQLDFDGSYEAS